MKYPSRYSNGKDVSSAQYITEIICEKKALMDKEDLHHRFWTLPKWEKFYRNQISSAHKLIKKYGEKAVIRALNNSKASKIYSLRAPHLPAIIELEAKKLMTENSNLTKKFERKDQISHRKINQKNKSILSKLEDIDNGS
jgi:hypothetical protein